MTLTQLQFGQLGQPLPRVPSLRVLRETPASRIGQCGAKSVSLLELIGAIVGDPDVALRLLALCPTFDELLHTPASELGQIKGLGQARIAALQAAIELGRRAQLGDDVERKQICSPADAANLLLSEMSALEQEELRVMILDTRNRVLSVDTIYRGNVNTSIVRNAEVFREAIRRNAPAVIVFHNHPSGSPDPSPEDVSTTRSMISAGKMLDIEVMDHIIFGRNRYVSLKERGLGFA
jgi:DNA repair protein RadC